MRRNVVGYQANFLPCVSPSALAGGEKKILSTKDLSFNLLAICCSSRIRDISFSFVGDFLIYPTLLYLSFLSK